MNENSEQAKMRNEARNDFDKARRRAFRSEIGSRLRGRQNRLIPFDEIRAELRQQNTRYLGIQQIRIDDIIGSVGRYLDFNRQFLPLSDSMRDRWVNVQALTADMGWPPIELYKVGDAYFVRDGNHRTAIARQMGNSTIEAHVWEFPTSISLSTVQSLDDALITLGEEAFETRTDISEFAPDHNIRFTVPGRYSELFAQIEDIRGKISRLDGTDLTFKDAAPLWYDLVYLPTIQIIEDSPLDEAFSGRTVADLFVWMSIHRTQLGELYGEYDNLSDLAAMLIDRYKPAGIGKMARQVRNLLGAEALPHLVEVDEVKEGLNSAENSNANP